MKIKSKTPLWLKRWIFYLVIYFIIVIPIHLILSRLGFLYTNLDSARYMLSALVQSEAAILGIVITLSLIVMQLASQSYSIRIADLINKNSHDFIILISIYGTAIFYGLIVLKLIGEFNLKNFEPYINIAYYFGIFAFFALTPYINNTINMIKPSTIINLLSEEITSDKILYSINEKQGKAEDKNPVQPIIDMLRSSLMRYDYETVREGLRVIGDRTNHIFENETPNREDEEKISEYIFDHLTRFGKLTVRRKDEDSTIEVIKSLSQIGTTTIRKKYSIATKKVFFSLDIVGKASAIQKLDDATSRSIVSFLHLGKGAVEQDNQPASNYSIYSLRKMGKISAKQDLITQTNYSVNYLGEMGMLTIKHKDEKTTKNAVYSLFDVGKVTVEQKLEFPTIMTLISLGKIGTIAVDRKLDVVNNVTDCIKKLGVLATEQKFKNVSNVSIKLLENIGKIAAQKHLELTATNTIDALKVVGIAVAEQKFAKTANIASKALFEVGKVAAEQEFEDDVVTQHIKEAFEDFIRILEDPKLDWVKTNTQSYHSDFIRCL